MSKTRRSRRRKNARPEKAGRRKRQEESEEARQARKAMKPYLRSPTGTTARVGSIRKGACRLFFWNPVDLDYTLGGGQHWTPEELARVPVRYLQRKPKPGPLWSPTKEKNAR